MCSVCELFRCVLQLLCTLRVFRSLSMTSIWGSIHQGHEAFSEHSRGRQCAFVSLAALPFLAVQWNTRIEVYAVTGELWHFFVCLNSFADLLWLLLFEEAFIKVMKLLVSILEAESLHILESIREVSFDQDRWLTYRKKGPMFVTCCVLINPKNQHLNQIKGLFEAKTILHDEVHASV